MFGQGVAQMTVGSSTRPANNGKHSTAALVTAAICLTATLLVVSGEPEPYHPEWAIVTTEDPFGPTALPLQRLTP